jgi:hypothetical protein
MKNVCFLFRSRRGGFCNPKERIKTMQDKNGKEIKVGDVVVISGGYFKADNGRFRVEHVPGEGNWLGKECNLRRIKRDGTYSAGKYTIAFWPLSVTVGGYEKYRAAMKHNAENAQIEIVN